MGGSKIPEIAFNCLFKHSKKQLNIMKNNSVNSIVPVLFSIKNKLTEQYQGIPSSSYGALTSSAFEFHHS
jgi:hypothetical protein